MSFKSDVTWVGPKVVCVCVREREREREWWVQLLCVCVCERERENILSFMLGLLLFNYVGLKTLSCC